MSDRPLLRVCVQRMILVSVTTTVVNGVVETRAEWTGTALSLQAIIIGGCHSGRVEMKHKRREEHLLLLENNREGTRSRDPT